MKKTKLIFVFLFLSMVLVGQSQLDSLVEALFKKSWMRLVTTPTWCTERKGQLWLVTTRTWCTERKGQQRLVTTPGCRDGWWELFAIGVNTNLFECSSKGQSPATKKIV